MTADPRRSMATVLWGASGTGFAGRDTTVRILQVEDGKEVAKFGKPRGGQFYDWINAISLSPDEKWVAGADISGHVQVWKLG